MTTPRYGAALQWAEELHRAQRRNGKQVPYISHLISVSALVWEDGGNEDQAIAALLHDAIEDAGQIHASIAEHFGAAVADIVRDCTDTSPEAKPGEKEPWLLRKTRYLDSLAGKPINSLLVTAADKAHIVGAGSTPDAMAGSLQSTPTPPSAHGQAGRTEAQAGSTAQHRRQPVVDS